MAERAFVFEARDKVSEFVVGERGEILLALAMICEQAVAWSYMRSSLQSPSSMQSLGNKQANLARV